MFFYIILTVHSALCLSLVFLVLLQQGKGADAGATFGGGNSNSVLGVGGAADFITKLTTSLAIAFMVTSIILVRSYQDRGVLTTGRVADPLEGSVLQGAVQEAPVQELAVDDAAAPAKEADAAAAEQPEAAMKKEATTEKTSTDEASKEEKESTPVKAEKASEETPK